MNSSSWRLEFGCRRWRCYGALEEKPEGATCSWGFAEHADELRCELARLWPRLHHGRRRDASVMVGDRARERAEVRKHGGKKEELTADP